MSIYKAPGSGASDHNLEARSKPDDVRTRYASRVKETMSLLPAANVRLAVDWRMGLIQAEIASSPRLWRDFSQ